MANNNWACLLLSLPPLAKWLRQMGVAIVIAASFLPLRAEAAALPPLVTIATRVVGTGSNPYSTQVGNATYSATGGGPGYHVVALNRATLAPLFNNTYGVDFTSLQSMSNDVTGLGNTALVIITSIGPPTSIASAALGFLNNVAASLGGTGQGYIYCFGTFIAATNSSPSAYSLIGIPGSGAPATQASATCANPDSDGNIAGVLVLDINENYAITYSKFVTIQTMTGPQADTIMIGNKAFEAPPLPAGAQGGFHLLIVKRTTLDRVATDPTVVFLNASYATNSNNQSFATSEAGRMASDLQRFPNGLSAGELIVILASLGRNPGFNLNVHEFSILVVIESVITQLGGVGDLAVLGANGYYSIIGIPNSGDPTLSPEVRSYATPQLSGNITAVLQQNNVGLFTPISSSAFPNVSLDLSLYSTAFAAPVPWPVAPHGSDAVCPTGDEQCAAYKWISFQIICAGNPLCTDEDIRGHYADLTFSPSSELALLLNLTYPSQPTTQPPGFRFSETAFNQVKNHLETELTLVADVQNFFKNNLTLQVVLATLLQDDLQSAYSEVQTDVQLPPSMSAPSFNILGVVRDALMVGQIVAGAAQPELVPVFAIGNAALYLQMQFNNTPKGASNNQVLATVGDLETQIGNAFSSGLANFGVLESILLSDWNKLQTIGTKIQNAQSGSPWFWSPDTTGQVASNLASAYKVSFYQALLPAKYQIVTFDNVPFNNPSDYSYSYDCNPSFAVCCCTGSIYSPPSGAWVISSDSSNTIFMAISPSDGSYPSNTLTGKLFSTMHLYIWDFFLSQRRWSAMTEALPQGWSDYQARGLCGSPSSACAVPQPSLMHGLPGAVLPQKLATPLDDPGACGLRENRHKKFCKHRGDGGEDD